jgi:hypothetical protein
MSFMTSSEMDANAIMKDIGKSQMAFSTTSTKNELMLKTMWCD